VKLSEIAAQLGAELLGDGNLDISSAAAIESAKPDQITFLANDKYAKFLPETRAGAVILKEKPADSTHNYLIHSEPYYAFARSLRFFYPLPQTSLTAGTASSAVIAADARVPESVHVGDFVQIGAGSAIGKNSKIMANCVIGRNCAIGDNCLIYPNVTIYDETIIGNNVSIHAGTVIGSDGYGYALYQGEHFKVLQIGRVRIEDDVEIGANTTVDRAALGETVIGKGTKIDNLVQVAHNVKIGKGSLLVSQSGVSGSTTLGEYVILAGQAGLVGHITVGDRTIVGAQAGVGHNLEADKIYGGSPAREFRNWKKLEAHFARLPERMKELKELRRKVDELAAQLSRLESEK
jgi:UDP-3-O-[3-hydroxymyristoyl] glucosamine N-acyltransferase